MHNPERVSAQSPPEQDLSLLLERERQRQALPAVAAAVIQGQEIVASGVAGVRKQGASVQAEWSDRWHIGSCTKSMTATMVGVLVERDVLQWDLTVADALPGLRDRLHPQYRSVTLEMLLSNRGGIGNEQEILGLWDELWRREGTPVEQRRRMAEVMLAQPPKVPPGTFFYANCGFAIAGHIAETIVGKPWEDLMQDLVFRPLGMASAGYGVPWDDPRITEPWPHEHNGHAITPGPLADNPPAIGPAGTVHVSLVDWAKYVAEHLRGDRGLDGKLLKASTYAHLHQGIPIEGDQNSYALGWVVLNRPWARGDRPEDVGRCLHHSGSNNSWFALVWIAPERNTAVLCTTNIGGDTIFPKIDAVIWAVIQNHFNL